MPTHLPPRDMLADYASGTCSPGVALAVASHLARAPESRASAGQLESLGSALLAEEAPAELGDGALDAVLGRLDEAAPVPRAQEEGPLPPCLAELVGGRVDTLAWRFRLPGVHEYVLPDFGPERVSLLRARPGTRIPRHTHEGREITLVLAGAMEDGGTVYAAGDMAVGDEDIDHQPRIIGEETCYCLIVMEGSLRFTGRFTRALNYFAE